MNKFDQINTIIKKIKATGTTIISTIYEPSDKTITIKSRDKNICVSTTRYELEELT